VSFVIVGPTHGKKMGDLIVFGPGRAGSRTTSVYVSCERPAGVKRAYREVHMNIRKRSLAIATTAALAGLSVIAVPAAHAAGPAKHDASNDKVTCNDVMGKIKFGIPLTVGGTTPNTITLTIKSDDCTDTTAGIYDPVGNPTGVSIKSAAAKGVLNSTNNDCFGLQGLSTGTSGAITASWAMNSATPALLSAPTATPPVSNKTTLNITQEWGGTFNDGGSTSPASASDSWGGTYGFFAIGSSTSGLPIGTVNSGTPPDHQHYTTAPSITGAFTGGNGGATTMFQGVTQQSKGSLGVACLTTGIKGIDFGLGGFTFQ
jgi:hypothetical protein